MNKFMRSLLNLSIGELATAFYIFGIIEYINYYWYRLSYGKSGFNIRKLKKAGLRKSSISKIIDKSGG